MMDENYEYQNDPLFNDPESGMDRLSKKYDGRICLLFGSRKCPIERNSLKTYLKQKHNLYAENVYMSDEPTYLELHKYSCILPLDVSACKFTVPMKNSLTLRSRDEYDVLFNKERCYNDILSRNNNIVPCIPTISANSSVENVSRFQSLTDTQNFILKPNNEESGRGVRVLSSQKLLFKYGSFGTNYIIQPEIRDHIVYNSDILVHNGIIIRHFIATTNSLYMYMYVTGFKVKLVTNDVFDENIKLIHEKNDALARTHLYNGIFNIEYIYGIDWNETNQLYILEINPRPGASYYIYDSYGHNLAVELLFGEYFSIFDFEFQEKEIQEDTLRYESFIGCELRRGKHPYLYTTILVLILSTIYLFYKNRLGGIPKNKLKSKGIPLNINGIITDEQKKEILSRIN
jgi:hypothetical protein